MAPSDKSLQKKNTKQGKDNIKKDLQLSAKLTTKKKSILSSNLHNNFNEKKKPSNNKLRRKKRVQEFKKRQKIVKDSHNNDIKMKYTEKKSKISNCLTDNIKSATESDNISNMHLTKDHPDLVKRTLYVGNVNVATSRKKLKFFFGKFGQVETVRLRGIAVEGINVSKKEAITMKKLHPSRKSIIAYVQFVNEESVEKALAANGKVLQNHHLSVDKAEREKNSKTQKLSIFIGNLAFNVEEEDVWNFFEPCGNIASVRVVRSSTVGSGKGFGFVSFMNKEALLQAIEMDGEELVGRNIRIQRAAKKPKLKSIPSENERTSVLKMDKPEQLRQKMQQRTEKLKTMAGASYLGKKSVAGAKRKSIKKTKWKPLSKQEKLQKFFAKSLGRASKTEN